MLKNHEESDSDPEKFPYELPKSKQLGKLPSSYELNGLKVKVAQLTLMEPCPSSDEDSPLRRMKPLKVSRTVTRPAD